MTVSVTYGADIEDNVKEFNKVKDWYSFSVVDTFFGSTLGTRAATEDRRTGATLALNYPTDDSCKLSPINIIYKTNSAATEDSEDTIYGNIQVEGSTSEYVEAKLHHETGSEFLFIVVNDKTFDNKLRKGKSVFVNFKGFGVSEFSLDGAIEAIDQAKFDCKDHIYE